MESKDSRFKVCMVVETAVIVLWVTTLCSPVNGINILEEHFQGSSEMLVAVHLSD
jgi:hypothetical protein